jgi:hypothetical protein
VKAQYFGDVNDYRKFALLRLLTEVGGFRIGVCWRLTEPDDTGQGGNRGYLQGSAKWGGYDGKVFHALQSAPRPPNVPSLRDLQRVEAEGLIPGATYVEAPLPDARVERGAWHASCRGAFAGVDLAFFDPDNGLRFRGSPAGGRTQTSTRL